MSVTKTSSNRVSEHTNPVFNEKIRKLTDQSIEYHSMHPELIEQRLRELEEEWDIERAIEANASTLMIIGLVSGLAFHRKCLALSCLVAGFLFQHAAQGWCPPVPVLRRLGFRTKEEILRERYALRILRGDFNNIGEVEKAPLEEKVQHIINAVNE
ncbi:MAG: hypothetical protein AB1650_08700 [Candidatus Omnitrophota bacterium]